MCAAVFAAGFGGAPSALHAQVRGTYLYTLSNFSGKVTDDWVRISVDPETDETYALYQNQVRIYSGTGMEVFTFGADLDVGQVLDAAVAPNGDVLLLSFKGDRSLVTRCNYRGTPIGTVVLTNLPEGLTFVANRMLLRNGRMYFLSTPTSLLLVTDQQGAVTEQVNLLAAVEGDDRQKVGAEVGGFTVDDEGSVYFSVPVLFKVYKRTADGALASFGRSGSAAGRFGVVAGLAVDSRGNVLVADKLRCVVMAFDRTFNFLAEFGYRGARPENLVGPADLAIDHRDRLYVSQGRKRGVSVFSLAN